MSPGIILASEENHLLITLPPSNSANQMLPCCLGMRRRGVGEGGGGDRQPPCAAATHSRKRRPPQSQAENQIDWSPRAAAWKSDYRRGSPQFPGHSGAHRKHSGLENVHLFLSARTGGGWRLVGLIKWGKATAAGGGLRLIKCSPPCPNR